ncbi:hypothetical protein K1W54_38175 [Micromonospora sp. CPCC 205371]|nr:hypothetical protein [Micromonospora sp. CPCC 205371]
MDSGYLAKDALLGMLFPFWQLVIGAFVVVTLVLSVRQLARRGRSRMMTAMLISGGAVVGLTVLGVLLS